MNFRERIGNTKNFKITDNGINYNSNEDIMVMSYFQRDEEAEKILRRILIGKKNVILLSRKDVDNNLLCFYIRKFISKNESVEILQNVKDDVEFVSASKVIIPKPSVQDVIKLFELILCDYKTFIWTMNVKSFGKITETLETLILLNSNNLTRQNAQHLIGSSDSCLVYFDTDESGIYYISDIATIEYDDCVKLKTLYSKYDEIDEDIVEVKQNNSEDFYNSNSAENVYNGQSDCIKGTDFKQNDLSDELIDSAIRSIKSMDKESVSNNDAEDSKNIIENEDEIDFENEIAEEKSSDEQSVEHTVTDAITDEDITETSDLMNENVENPDALNSLVSNDIDDIIDEETVQNETPSKKINKYKQLKEKVRMRKNSEQ